MERFTAWLSNLVDGRVLGLFRIIFGLFMAYYCIYYHNAQFIKQGLLAPSMQFKYEGFEWVGLLPAPMMQGLLASMFVAAILMALGIRLKLVALWYAIGLAYFTLVEKAYYNNHIYLFILLCFLFSFTDADRFLSVRGNRGYGPMVPRWQPFLFQCQVCIVYFYGGLAKLTPDWLFRQEPMRTVADEYMGYNNEFMVMLLNYGGLLLDLGAPLVLWCKPLRRWGIVPIILFHIANSQIFNDIGIFPFVMLAALGLYYETHELPFVGRFFGKTLNLDKMPKTPKYTHKTVAQVLPPIAPWSKVSLIAYFGLQLLFPLRGFLSPNPTDYTSIGNRFSWHMKIDARDAEEIIWFIRRKDTGEERQIKVETYLNPMQIQLLMMDPRAVVAFGRFLGEKAAKVNTPVSVRAQIKFRYNGRPAQYFVDPHVDLTQAQYGLFSRIEWVLPLL